MPLLVLEWLQGRALDSAFALAARGGVREGKGGIRVSPPVMDEVLKQLMDAKEELQRLSEQAVAGVHTGLMHA